MNEWGGLTLGRRPSISISMSMSKLDGFDLMAADWLVVTWVAPSARMSTRRDIRRTLKSTRRTGFAVVTSSHLYFFFFLFIPTNCSRMYLYRVSL